MLKKVLPILLSGMMCVNGISTVKANEPTDLNDEEAVAQTEEVLAEEETSTEKEEVIVAEDEEVIYPDGVTVVADAQSPTGYTAHFVYNPEKNDIETADIANVVLNGSFRLVSSDVDLSTVHSDHGFDTYKNGDFITTLHAQTYYTIRPEEDFGYQWQYEMTFNEKTGKYEMSIPMVSGAHTYNYIVTYKDGTSVTFDDPANPSLVRENEQNRGWN